MTDLFSKFTDVLPSGQDNDERDLHEEGEGEIENWREEEWGEQWEFELEYDVEDQEYEEDGEDDDVDDDDDDDDDDDEQEEEDDSHTRNNRCNMLQLSATNLYAMENILTV